MKTSSLLAGLAVLGGLAGGALLAQDAISAKAGMINYTEGRVLLNNSTLQKTGRFAQMKAQDVLSTKDGRAEVLLNPGTFVRVAPDSSIRLISDSLDTPAFELKAGAVVLEVAEISKRTSLTVTWKEVTITPTKHGVFRVDADPAGLRVFDGEVLVTSEGRSVKVGKAKMLPFDGTWAWVKFDREQMDALDRWSGRRAAYVATANPSTARSVLRPTRGFGSYWGCGWAWNSYFGSVTYVPCNGTYNSYYGYNFYGLNTVMSLYTAPRVIAPSGGGGPSSSPSYSTNASTSAGTSGTIAASSPASTTQSGASSAPISRDAGSAGGTRR